MPHASFKVIPGVDTTKTPALNEAAISQSQLIRFVPDRTLGGLVQKLGGWTKFCLNNIRSIVRCLWAWEDTNANSYLGIGAEGVSAGGGFTLQVKKSIDTNPIDITPQTSIVNVAVNFSTTVGSNAITITDVGRNADNYDVVDIQTQVSVGGIVLFGQYQIYNPGGSANTYTIYATNIFGDPDNATSTVSNGGVVPLIGTTSGSNFANITLPNHGYNIGDTFPILVSTTVGGIIFFGNSIVTDVSSTSDFQISGRTVASSTATGYINSGLAHFLYYNGVGALSAGTGYGIGAYGAGGYGTGVAPTPGTGNKINAIDWSLDNWGETLIASPLNGPIYQWSPLSGPPTALIIPEAPPVNKGCFVAMPQRQIIAWGSTFTGIIDPMLIRWCDVNNYNNWTALITNQAGSFRIPKGSRIVQCIQGPQQGLIWTDLGVWAMQYVGPPYVYQFNELGNGCGLIGRKAAGSMNGGIYWKGPSQFYRLAGSGVEPIKCPVWDVIFQDLDTDNLDKIRIAPNSRFGEVAWYYPTQGNGGEISNYVKYNILLDQWDYGTLARTAWINESVLGPPIGADPNTYIYQHETSPNADGNPMTSYFQTGYFALTEANVKMFVDQVWPDMKWGYYGDTTPNANILLTFYVTDYAGQTPIQYGPFTMTQLTTYVTPRFRGRLVSIRVESNDIDSWWRLGNTRYRVQEDGKY
jgi:hypothetical protein